MDELKHETSPYTDIDPQPCRDITCASPAPTFADSGYIKWPRPTQRTISILTNLFYNIGAAISQKNIRHENNQAKKEEEAWLPLVIIATVLIPSASAKNEACEAACVAALVACMAGVVFGILDAGHCQHLAHVCHAGCN